MCIFGNTFQNHRAYRGRSTKRVHSALTIAVHTSHNYHHFVNVLSNTPENNVAESNGPFISLFSRII